MPWNLILVPALVWLGLCLLAWVFQERLIYWPGAAPRMTPKALGLEFTEAPLSTRDGVALHAWMIPAGQPRGAALVCHGNAGSIEHRILLAQALRECGLSVLLFDYRGYGLSRGRPSEEGVYLDAEAAHDWLTSQAGFAPERIVAYGESLGAAIAVELAHRRRVGALVMESGFTSLADAGGEAYWYLPVRLLLRSRFETRARLADLDLPALFIHSRDDEIVRFRHSQALFEAARGPKRLLATSGGHNDGGWLVSAEHRRAVCAFVAESLP